MANGHASFRQGLPAAAYTVLAAACIAAALTAQGAAPADPAALAAEGQVLYHRDCASCHGADGQGDGAGPALAGNTTLARKEHVVKRILFGATDKGMDPFTSFTDREVAAVASFLRNAWDNAHGPVSEADVKVLRAAGPK